MDNEIIIEGNEVVETITVRHDLQEYIETKRGEIESLQSKINENQLKITSILEELSGLL